MVPASCRTVSSLPEQPVSVVHTFLKQSTCHCHRADDLHTLHTATTAPLRVSTRRSHCRLHFTYHARLLSPRRLMLQALCVHPNISLSTLSVSFSPSAPASQTSLLSSLYLALSLSHFHYARTRATSSNSSLCLVLRGGLRVTASRSSEDSKRRQVVSLHPYMRDKHMGRQHAEPTLSLPPPGLVPASASLCLSVVGSRLATVLS